MTQISSTAASYYAKDLRYFRQRHSATRDKDRPTTGELGHLRNVSDTRLLYCEGDPRHTTIPTIAHHPQSKLAQKAGQGNNGDSVN